MTTTTQPLVMIVENDVFLAKMWKAKLSKEDCRVIENYSGENALEQVIAEKPDLILLDIGLDKDDGISILRSLRETPATKHIPVLMITKLTGDDDVKTVAEAGAQEYLMKPNLNFKTVIEAVKEYVFHGAKSTPPSNAKQCSACQQPLFPGGHYCPHCGVRAR